MRLGLLLRADRTGLGVQTQNYWKHLKPDVSLLVDLHHCSGQSPDPTIYASDPNVIAWHDPRYPNLGLHADRVVEAFLDRCDVVFSAETFYSWWLVQRAREKGVRTVLAPNPEFLEALLVPDLPEPDVYALPTTWLEHRIRKQLPGRCIINLPVPMDRDLLPYRHRPALKTILHIAGTPAIADRNGTHTLIEAMRHVQSPVTCVIKTQKVLESQPAPNTTIDHRPVQNYWDLYRGDYDMLVMPRKFGGLCLPVNEALSSGMPVLMSAVSPQREWLPPDLVVPASEVDQVMTRTMIGINEVHPVELAKRIDWFYDNPQSFASLSEWADQWASAHSWEALLPLYERTLFG